MLFAERPKSGKCPKIDTSEINPPALQPGNETAVKLDPALRPRMLAVIAQFLLSEIASEQVIIPALGSNQSALLWYSQLLIVEQTHVIEDCAFHLLSPLQTV